MCGIAGYLTDLKFTPDASLLQRMCDRIEHRGPDACGYFTAEGVALGHRRLSIIDVGGGAQPLGNEDGSVQVIFNGEIYNYPELRRSLVAKGHQFATQSDTEVLVHLYEEVGDNLAQQLNGMFAFALWDSRRKRLLLGRDRLGKKPLYYSSAAPGIRFCFASELKALTAIPGFDPKVNRRAVADFLQLSYVPDPDSIYEGIFKLPPAHCMVVEAAGERIWRYWAPNFEAAWNGDINEASEEVLDLALDSVKRRMISDVPLGAFLSGGVDSSAVVACMAQDAGERVKTFSIGFTDKTFDELRYARVIAGRYETEHHEEVVTPDILEVLPVLLKHYDEPFGDTSAVPMLYVARMARRHVTVALSGDGADEIFGGYDRYRIALAENRLRRIFPEWVRSSLLDFGARRYPPLYSWPRMFRAKATLTFLSQQFGDAYFSTMSVFRDERMEDVFSPEMNRDLGGYSSRAKFRSLFEPVRHLHPLQQMQAVDLQTYLPGDILVKVDRATMAYSLEGRCPWLDYRLAELAGSLPPHFKLGDGVGKRVFKAAMARHVPNALIARRKMGFATPLATWLRTTLKTTFERIALAPDTGEFVSPAAVHKMWQEHQSGLRNHDRKLWNVLVLSLWEAGRRGRTVSEVAAQCV